MLNDEKILGINDTQLAALIVVLPQRPAAKHQKKSKYTESAESTARSQGTTTRHNTSSTQRPSANSAGNPVSKATTSIHDTRQKEVADKIRQGSSPK